MKSTSKPHTILETIRYHAKLPEDCDWPQINSARDSHGQSPLHLATFLGYTDLLDHLLPHATPEALLSTDNYQRNLLHLAAGSLSPSTLDYLLQSELTQYKELLQQDRLGRNPLHIICQSGSAQQLNSFLLSPYAEYLSDLLIQRDQFGNTPLHHVCISANSEALALITQLELDETTTASMWSPNDEPASPTLLAYRFGDAEFIRTVLDAHQTLPQSTLKQQFQASPTGQTPMHWVVLGQRQSAKAATYHAPAATLFPMHYFQRSHQTLRTPLDALSTEEIAQLEQALPPESPAKPVLQTLNWLQSNDYPNIVRFWTGIWKHAQCKKILNLAYLSPPCVTILFNIHRGALLDRLTPALETLNPLQQSNLFPLLDPDRILKLVQSWTPETKAAFQLAQVTVEGIPPLNGKDALGEMSLLQDLSPEERQQRGCNNAKAINQIPGFALACMMEVPILQRKILSHLPWLNAVARRAITPFISLGAIPSFKTLAALSPFMTLAQKTEVVQNFSLERIQQEYHLPKNRPWAPSNVQDKLQEVQLYVSHLQVFLKALNQKPSSSKLQQCAQEILNDLAELSQVLQDLQRKGKI